LPIDRLLYKSISFLAAEYITNVQELKSKISPVAALTGGPQALNNSRQLAPDWNFSPPLPLTASSLFDLPVSVGLAL
jgi:hypothetical protein